MPGASSPRDRSRASRDRRNASEPGNMAARESDLQQRVYSGRFSIALFPARCRRGSRSASERSTDDETSMFSSAAADAETRTIFLAFCGMQSERDFFRSGPAPLVWENFLRYCGTSDIALAEVIETQPEIFFSPTWTLPLLRDLHRLRDT